MTLYLLSVAAVLLAILLVGGARVLKGPSRADRMLATQLFSTAGVAILAVLAVARDQYALLDVALVLALLAPLTLIAFIRLKGAKQ